MNSFSYEVKKEALQIVPTDQQSALSELSALIKTMGEMERNNEGIKIILKTELEEIFVIVNKILTLLYNRVATMTTCAQLSYGKSYRYLISLPSELSRQILLDTEIMYFDEDKFLCLTEGISKYLVQEEDLISAYIRGAFIGSFSCNINTESQDPTQIKNSGYHAEFVFDNQFYAQQFSLLLAEYDIITKMVERKSFFVVYIKDMDMISDLFALVGAKNGVFKIQNESALRSIRNTVNRQNNCITANVSKTVEASVREIEAIYLISETIGLDKLDVNLQTVAKLRLENREESLDDLIKLSSEKISKSGLYHRLKKLEKIANQLK